MKFAPGIIITVLVLLCPNAEGQIQVYQLSLQDSTKTVLYCGFDNKIRLHRLPFGARVSFAGNTIIEHRNAGDYHVRASHCKGRDTLVVSKGKSVLFKRPYRIETIPDPKLAFGILKDSSGSVSQILAQPNLRVDLPGSLLKSYLIEVFSFNIEIVHRNEPACPLTTVNGGSLQLSQIAVIRRLIPGDFIQFTNVTGGGPDSMLRNFGDLKITIR